MRRPSRPVNVHSMSHAGTSVTPQLAFGIFIMLLGVLLTLDRLRLIDTADVLRLWPAGFIVLGATILTRGIGPHGRFWGTAWILFGTWLLLNTLNIVQVGFWELFWPVVLMLIGGSLVMQTMRHGGWPRSSGTGAPSSNLFAVMGESKRHLDDNPFRGGSMTAFMGGCVLDLRQASIAPGQEAFIDVLAIMAGHEIVVPVGWEVVSQIVPIMGSVEDKRLAPAGP